MKKFVAASVAALALSTTAFAADLPVRTMAPAPSMAYAAVPAFTWTGFYAGVNAGYAWSDVDARVGELEGTAAVPPFVIRPGAGIPYGFDLEDDGFAFGAQAGFNWQLGSLVAGVEADITRLGHSARDGEVHTLYGLCDPDFFLNTRARSSLDWLATLRARLGVAFDRTLFYGTAGAAWGRTSYGVDINTGCTGPLGTFPTRSGRESDTSTGYVVGAGVEHAFTNNLTLKLEFVHYDLGDQTVRVQYTPAPGDIFDTKFENSGQIARLGVNWKF